MEDISSASIPGMRTSALFLLMSCCLLGFCFTPPADLMEAMELCDRSDLRPIEGIWSFPEDDVSVLIFRDSDNDSRYGVWVVESADCSLNPRDRLGTLHSSPDPNKFKLTLYTVVKKGKFSTPCNASAVLSSSHESITVTKPSIKVSVYPGRLLTGFWGVVRLSVKNAANIPEGMIRAYPSYDGNYSSRRTPRYL